MKCIWLVILLLTCTVRSVNTAQNATQPTINSQQQANGKQATTLSKAPVAKADAAREPQHNSESPHNDNNGHETRITSLPEVSIKPSKRDLVDWAYWAFSALLVIVGVCQTILLGMQWKVYTRQTKFQEVALVQWIEIEKDWTIQSVTQHEGRTMLDITFGLKNPSNYPLTLRTLSFELNTEKTTMHLDRQLAPHETRLIGTTYIVSPEQENSRQMTVLPLFIDGTITFTDILEREKFQTFGGGIVCEKERGHFVDCTRAPRPTK